MHKRLVNHCTIALTIIPRGPLLIKSGKEGADPTKPDMEFVETYHANGRSIYLPGSSLKGAIRAHAERIVRTMGSDRRPQTETKIPWANDPLTDDYDYLKNVKVGSQIYQLSSFTDQLFGNTAIASRLRIEDAYPNPDQPIKLEERNGVAIDRVFGSVAVGPFNFEVCTAGEFQTKIHLKNFTLPQLGLLGLVLRDLKDGWFGLGFAKSRGLGTVDIRFEKAQVQYPGCEIQAGKIARLGQEPWSQNLLLGAGEFLSDQEATEAYGFPKPDRQLVPVAPQPMDLGLGVVLTWEGNDAQTGVPDLLTRAVNAWKALFLEVAA